MRAVSHQHTALKCTCCPSGRAASSFPSRRCSTLRGTRSCTRTRSSSGACSGCAPPPRSAPPSAAPVSRCLAPPPARDALGRFSVSLAFSRPSPSCAQTSPQCRSTNAPAAAAGRCPSWQCRAARHVQSAGRWETRTGCKGTRARPF